MENNVNKLLERIFQKSKLQRKYFEKNIVSYTQEELDAFGALLDYYIGSGFSIDKLADSYMFFIDDVKEEQFEFFHTHHYRYGSADDVDKYIYSDPDYMTKYMVGLNLSVYLLDSHRKYINWYSDKIKGKMGGLWLEIGPGHGEYLVKAVRLTNFESYLGIDISKTAVEMCDKMISSRIEKQYLNKIRIEQGDFYELDTEQTAFDAIVVGEVLEHVENPMSFMNKLYEISSSETFLYITTVTNCPQKDHIFLFHDVSEIEDLYRKSGFEVEDSILIPTNGYSVEKAEEMNVTINTGHILRKRC